jgi:hypothetical protein
MSEFLKWITGWKLIEMIINAIKGKGSSGDSSASGQWRGCMFTPASAGFPNNNGVTSQLEYRGVHGQSNEDAQRIDMFSHVKKWGGNALVHIRGNWGIGNTVLDMCLNGRAHPVDGHYFPITGKPESDFAMWAKQEYGIDKHICFIWNDDCSMAVKEQVVIDAVAAYDGTRLGIENVAFGVCLETNEIIPDPATAATTAKWIKAHATSSPCIVGSASVDYLLAVAGKVDGIYLWLEQATGGGSPVTVPLTRSTFAAYKSSLDKLADKVGKSKVIPGEWWASSADDVAWMTQQLLNAGYSFLGSGKYK